MNRYLVTVNPFSGKRNNSRKIKAIRKFFDDSGVEFEILETTEEVRMDELARKHFNDTFTHLIIAGGDGSINESINGLPDFTRPYGIIPMGRGNDFVKNFSLSNDWNYLLGEKVRDVDVGICNDRKFLNGIGAGFDGQIIVNMAKSNTWFKGHAAYYYHVIKILSSYRERKIRFRLDAEEHEAHIILIIAANGTTFGGGFKLAPEATVDDGLLDVCIVKSLSPFKRFLHLSKLKNGSHLKMDPVEYKQVRSLEVDGSDIHGQIDGEYFGTPPYKISILPEKLKLLVP